MSRKKSNIGRPRKGSRESRILTTTRKRLSCTSVKSPLKSPFRPVSYQASPARKKIKFSTNSLKSPYSKPPFKVHAISPLYKASPRRKLNKSSRATTKPCVKSILKSPIKASPVRKRLKSAKVLFKSNDGKENQDSDFRAISFESEFDKFICKSREEDIAEECVSENEADNKLQDNSDQTNLENNLIKLVPAVVSELSEKDDLDHVLLQFFEGVATKKIPLNNMAFLLFTDVVRWFNCSSSTTTMRYSDTSKQFWKLGWRLFGGRFLNFMGGFKNVGDERCNKSNKGSYKPELSEINFAVPDVNTLRNFDPYLVSGERKAGILQDSIKVMSDNMKGKSGCITFDGKKIKQQLTADAGDVDLLGFENGLSLQERKDNISMKLSYLEELTNTLGEKDNKEVVEILKEQLKEIAKDIVDIETLKTKKEYNMKKLIEKNGESDWRKGKYVYAISASRAFLHEIDQYIAKAKDTTDGICVLISQLNNKQFAREKTVNLYDSDTFFDIEHQLSSENSTCSRLIKQRSQEWHDLRKQAMVTGSTLYTALGCDTLIRQKDHFEKVICGVNEKEPTEEVKRNMEHGQLNEINAVATLVGRIIPVFEPNLVFCEEGCQPIYVPVRTPNLVSAEEYGFPVNTDELSEDDMKVFMVVSPDGSLRSDKSLESTKVAVEIKCPVRRVHGEFPQRYLLQCLSEIEVLHTDYLLFVSWTVQDTNVFKVMRNTRIFNKALKLATDTYGCVKPVKPTKLTDSMKALKSEIISESKKVELIGRVSSCVASTLLGTCPDNNVAKVNNTDIKSLIDDIKECFSDKYELRREKASEAVVFLAADLNRSWKREAVRSMPVAWFPKGYSLTCATMREIAEAVHNKCHEEGMHIPCESFDGQWHQLVVRGFDGEPLTVYQVQKDLWKSMDDKDKKEQLNDIKSLNRNVICQKEHVEGRLVIVATNGGKRLPRFRYVAKSSKESVEKEDIAADSDLSNLIPESIQETIEVDETVLAMSSVTDKIEMDAFASNVKDDCWMRYVMETQLDSEAEDDLLSLTEEAEIAEQEIMNKNNKNNASTQQQKGMNSRLKPADTKIHEKQARNQMNCEVREKSDLITTNHDTTRKLSKDVNCHELETDSITSGTVRKETCCQEMPRAESDNNIDMVTVILGNKDMHSEDITNGSNHHDITNISSENNNPVTKETNEGIDNTVNEGLKNMDNTSRTREIPKLTITDMQSILALFKSTKDCNRNDKWDNVSPDTLLEYFHSTEKLRGLLDIELRVILRYLKKSKGLSGTKEYVTKYIKLNAIAEFLDLETLKDVPKPKKIIKHTVATLKSLAGDVIDKYSKQQLNVIYAEYKWPQVYSDWSSTMKDVTLNGKEHEWFYKPEFSKYRKQLEVKCIDSTHLLTRSRRKSCHGGLDNIPKDPWLKVARTKKTLLTPIMVEDIVDPMSVAMAKTHFSEPVENVMRQMGFIEAADLCQDVRQWWESEDAPGVPAHTRIELRSKLRTRLLSKADFFRFPPATQYVAGWPIQLWEALIANIDAKALLYSLVHNGTYCVRAFSSLIGETFFSELALNDKRGQGVVTAKEFGEYIGYTTEQLQLRMDPDRSFAYCTSHHKVYDVVEESEVTDENRDECRICSFGPQTYVLPVCTKNHVFDSEGRRRLPGRRKNNTIDTSRNATMKGTLGVRFEKARTNMSKMLPTERMGIE